MPWTDLVAADAVAPGAVVPVEVGAYELVVWRTAAGAPVVCDARCPHQWSHLGVVGAVEGDELVCLSHFWRFDPTGRGSKLAMSGRRDPKSDVATYWTRETEGRIWADLP